MKAKEELLKIYSAYLPYDLSIQSNNGDEFYNSILDGIQSGNLYDEYGSEIEFPKPILYQMDMLTQEIEHNGERFVPLHKLLELYNFDLSKMDNEYILSFAKPLTEVDMSYTTAQKLLEWHFNVFGLDESEYIKKESLK